MILSGLILPIICKKYNISCILFSEDFKIVEFTDNLIDFVDLNYHQRYLTQSRYGYHVDADDFRTTRVVIQCKRFNSNPVSEPDINQFLGAMNKYQADYGVFITNSRFTNKAREAAREGTPITLIDGNDLIRLVIKYELYITPVTTYVLDGFYTED